MASRETGELWGGRGERSRLCRHPSAQHTAQWAGSSAWSSGGRAGMGKPSWDSAEEAGWEQRLFPAPPLAQRVGRRMEESPPKHALLQGQRRNLPPRTPVWPSARSWPPAGRAPARPASPPGPCALAHSSAGSPPEASKPSGTRSASRPDCASLQKEQHLRSGEGLSGTVSLFLRGRGAAPVTRGPSPKKEPLQGEVVPLRSTLLTWVPDAVAKGHCAVWTAAFTKRTRVNSGERARLLSGSIR